MKSPAIEAMILLLGFMALGWVIGQALVMFVLGPIVDQVWAVIR